MPNRIPIQADSVRRVGNRIELSGNVHVIFGSHSLKCEQATVHLDRKEVEASGNIFLATPEITMSGERININYETKVGTLFQGVIKMDQVLFEGEIIHMLGEREFEAVQADYTACTTCPPAWNFTGSKVSGTVGGYAHIRNPIIRVVKVPVLWLPYLIVPLNSKRQTGLLFPNWGYSDREGFSYGQSLFWAINQNTDATLTGQYFARRGLRGLAEYRYKLTDTTEGRAEYGYLSDKILTQDQFYRDKGLEGRALNRWHFKYDHQYDLPNNFVHRTNLKLLSDLRYPRDFSSDVQGWRDSAIENRMSLTRNSESIHMSLDAAHYRNMIRSDPQDQNLDSVHRFPEIRASLAPSRILGGPFLFDLDTKYVNFAREWYAFDDRKRVGSTFTSEDDPNAIGVYNSDRDLIRTGQRLDVTPRVSLPFALGPYVDVLPSISYRESQYRFPITGQDSAERRLIRSDVSFRTRFSRVFGDLENHKATRYRHEIVPEIKHTAIPWSARSRHPFFGITDEDSYFTANTALTDFDENKQFDYHDRLYERNLITAGISNYLIRKKWELENPVYKQIVLFRVQQSYDYAEAIRPGDPRQPYSDISGLLDVRLDWFETNSLVRYYPYQNVATAFSRVRLIHPRRHSLDVIYSQDYQIVKGQQVNTTARTEDITVAASLYFRMLDLMARSTYSFVTQKYSDYGYVLSLRPPGDCWQIAFGQTWLPNDIRYNLNVAFLFDGKNATSLSNASK